jgi:hypothetical protein
MERFTKALEAIAGVMREGAATHPGNDWVGRSPEYHLHRAEEHLRLCRDDEQLQDQMSHKLLYVGNTPRTQKKSRGSVGILIEA